MVIVGRRFHSVFIHEPRARVWRGQKEGIPMDFFQTSSLLKFGEICLDFSF